MSKQELAPGRLRAADDEHGLHSHLHASGVGLDLANDSKTILQTDYHMAAATACGPL